MLLVSLVSVGVRMGRAVVSESSICDQTLFPLVLNLLSILQLSYYNLAITVKRRLSPSPLHCSLFPSSSHLSFSLSTRLTQSIPVYHSCLASARKAILDQYFSSFAFTSPLPQYSSYSIARFRVLRECGLGFILLLSSGFLH